MSLALIDLDHFKSINDLHGHEVGDEVLKRVGGVMNGALGPNDVAARWGGEEFVLGLFGASAEEAVERLKSLLDQLNAATANSDVSIGFSGGVAECLSNEGDLPALLRCADAALYRAKQAGRGRVMIATAPRTGALAA